MAALPSAGAQPAAPLRVGVYHPHPRFCTPGAELAQKDLRVLRLVYGMSAEATARAEAPWFLVRPEPEGDALELRSGVLWGVPGAWLVHGQPDFRALRHPDQLAPWRARVLAAVPGLQPGLLLSRHPFRIGPGPTDPFLLSRLNGSGLVPARGDPAPGCPDWPVGVTYRGDARPYRYRLSRTAGPAGPTLEVRGYPTPGGLLYGLRRAHVHVALLEAQDVPRLRTALQGTKDLQWGWETGTQQIVLRLPSLLSASLGPLGRRALSQAVPRPALARLGTPGRFRAARAFLEPLLPAGGTAQSLVWDSREARTIWIAQKRSEARLRLEVLDHPWLRAIAVRTVRQWQRSLNLAVSVVPLNAEVFAAQARTGSPALRLDVVDLDDGSLQDLWLASAPEQGGPAQTLAWEQDFEARVPYLPLLVNLHFAVGTGADSAAHLRRACPACTLAPVGTLPPAFATNTER